MDPGRPHSALTMHWSQCSCSMPGHRGHDIVECQPIRHLRTLARTRPRCFLRTRAPSHSRQLIGYGREYPALIGGWRPPSQSQPSVLSFSLPELQPRILSYETNPTVSPCLCFVSSASSTSKSGHGGMKNHGKKLSKICVFGGRSPMIPD